MSEMICASYAKQKGMKYSALRISNVYGPTMNPSDSQVLSSFLFEAAQGNPIILKSDGMQRYTYVYVADVVSAIFYLLFRGDNRSYDCGEAEIIEEKTFGEIVQLIAEANDVPVKRGRLSEKEKNIYSNTVYRILTSENLYELGWKKKYTISDGIKRTSETLRSVYG
jgi:nucleoside-diphosphate-sugar epimerase